MALFWRATKKKNNVGETRKNLLLSVATCVFERHSASLFPFSSLFVLFGSFGGARLLRSAILFVLFFSALRFFLSIDFVPENTLRFITEFTCSEMFENNEHAPSVVTRCDRDAVCVYSLPAGRFLAAFRF